MSKINAKELKNAIKLLNESGLIEKAKLTKIKVVGVKMETLLNTFGDAVDSIADAKLDSEIDPAIIAFYNESFGDGNTSETEETEETEEKKTPKEKKTPPNKPRSCYGHIASAKSGHLDELLCKGGTYQELMDEVEVKLHRIKGHITVLKKKGLTLLVKENEKEPLKTHVQIKEDNI